MERLLHEEFLHYFLMGTYKKLVGAILHEEHTVYIHNQLDRKYQLKIEANCTKKSSLLQLCGKATKNVFNFFAMNALDIHGNSY